MYKMKHFIGPIKFPTLSFPHDQVKRKRSKAMTGGGKGSHHRIIKCQNGHSLVRKEFGIFSESNPIEFTLNLYPMVFFIYLYLN